jgi:predicted nuclease of restriction endonuclease-like (RecB) superfamily
LVGILKATNSSAKESLILATKRADTDAYSRVHPVALEQAKPVETREFYILAAIKERSTSRELERQLRSGAVLRDAQAAKKVSPALRQIHPTAIAEIKNAYNVEFLGLTTEHCEGDLHGALLRNLGQANRLILTGLLGSIR